MNWQKWYHSNCKNVLPHTKMAGCDKNYRTNSRTICQQNRIAFFHMYGGVVMLTWARREESLKMMAEATLPFPMKPANLLIGSKIVPPRFVLKLWTMMILLLASAANAAVLVSLVSNVSLALFVVVWAHSMEYTVVSLLPFLLPGRLTKWVCQFWDAMISISIAGGSGSADFRELGSIVAKNNDCCLSTLSPASNGCPTLGLPKTQVASNQEAGC
jgi:hypothetical protein